MTTKTTSSRAAARPSSPIPPDIGLTPPWTTQDRLVHIKALGQRVDHHVQFMCAITGLAGTSAEAKDRAVTVFYERLLSLERQLGQIQEELELG